MRNAESKWKVESRSEGRAAIPHSALRIPGGVVTPWDSQRVTDALGVPGPRGLRFTGVSTDTRHLAPGTLFVALQGERFDAHAFLAQAKAQGAAAAVVRRGTPAGDRLPFFQGARTPSPPGPLAPARPPLPPPGRPPPARPAP